VIGYVFVTREHAPWQLRHGLN